MKYILTGGGTGGHLYPLIAVAKALNAQGTGAEIIFAGNSLGLEASLIPAEGFEIKFISSGGFSSNPLKTGRSILKQVKGLFQSLSLISAFRPDVVIGSGGYVSAAVTLAAYIKKVPVLLLEQNTFPGKTNRFVAKFASKICAAFEESIRYFPPQKVIVTGNPVREEILSAKRDSARLALDIPSENKCLLIAGASQGAKSINSSVIRALAQWKGRDLTIIHLAGEKNYEEVLGKTEKYREEGKPDYRCLAFMKDIALAYASCDLAVCRAGATTIAELTARGVPSIMIPYPYAAENHQEKNARWLEKKGAALMIKDEELPAKFEETISRLLENDAELASMSASAAALGKPDALEQILKVLSGIVSKSKA